MAGDWRQEMKQTFKAIFINILFLLVSSQVYAVGLSEVEMMDLSARDNAEAEILRTGNRHKNYRPNGPMITYHPTRNYSRGRFFEDSSPNNFLNDLSLEAGKNLRTNFALNSTRNPYPPARKGSYFDDSSPDKASKYYRPDGLKDQFIYRFFYNCFYRLRVKQDWELGNNKDVSSRKWFPIRKAFLGSGECEETLTQVAYQTRSLLDTEAANNFWVEGWYRGDYRGSFKVYIPTEKTNSH